MADPTLLERADQQEAIDRALRDARHGGGGVLVIEGPAGIGKSRLLAELRGNVGAAQRVLFARASELERDFAFGVARQLLEGIYRDPELGPIATEGPAAAVRDVFEDAAGDEVGASFGLLHALHWMVLNLAEQQPLVLAVDDLHWCDSSSLRFLAYLGRRLEGTNILLAVATRPVATTSPEATLHADLVADPTAQHLFPQALSRNGTMALLTQQLGQEVAEAFADACHDATDGNPLMLRQLARSLVADGIAPTAEGAGGVRRTAHRALARTVLARVGRCSARAVDLARGVAVLGEPSIAEVSALVEREPQELDAAWRELVDIEVLHHQPLAFVHALVRDAVYHDLPPAERERLHARAARILHESGASVERVAGQLANVARQGDPWAADIAVAAGEAALRRGAPDAAAAHLRRALDEPIAAERRIPVMGQLAQALFEINSVAAQEVTDEIAASIDDPYERARVRLATVQLRALNDDWHGGFLLARDTMAELPPDDAELRPRFEAMRSIIAMFGSDDPEGLELLRPAYGAPAGSGLTERLRAGMVAYQWSLDGGSAEECRDLALAAIGDATDTLRDHVMIAVAPFQVLALADHAPVLDLWREALADGHRRGSLLTNLAVNMWMGLALQRFGDLSAAIPALEFTLRNMGQWGAGSQSERYMRGVLALAYLDRGEPTEAYAALGQDPRFAQGTTIGALWWLHGRTWCELALGEPARALESADELARRTQTWVRVPVGFDWRLPRAVALHRLGRVDEAIVTAHDGVRSAEPWGSPGVLGPAHRILGEVQGEAGIGELRRSVELLTGSAARIQLTRSLLALGGALRRAGEIAEARPMLQEARQLAEECGSPGLAEQARTELAASGLRARETDAAGAGALTPSERRVAELAADGRTNREIAQELFVTPKTVEVHLSATYRKLGIGGRRDLRGALIAP
jgi:DNA-binding CsgD family transcriptional regulator